MDDTDWDNISDDELQAYSQQEDDDFMQAYAGDDFMQAYSQQEDDDFLQAYTGDDYIQAYKDNGSDNDDGEKDYDDDEFSNFEDQDPDEFSLGYAQLEHISYGDIEMGTTIGGKFSKLEKIVQLQTVSKEKLYTNKLKMDLQTWFSSGNITSYAEQVQQVPRFWLKNSAAMAATIFMISKLNGSKVTAEKLTHYSQHTQIKSEDLYRYYKLLVSYIDVY